MEAETSRLTSRLAAEAEAMQGITGSLSLSRRCDSLKILLTSRGLHRLVTNPTRLTIQRLTATVPDDNPTFPLQRVPSYRFRSSAKQRFLNEIAPSLVIPCYELATRYRMHNVCSKTPSEYKIHRLILQRRF